MTRSSRVRIVATNDFFGSYAPMSTSYGALPGGEGLKLTVERLREGLPTIWADVGDFSQGGPLAPLSGGTLGFEAVSDLGIDVGVVGNHEFDWGVGHLKEHAPRTGYPLLCANADAGLSATALIPTEAGDVGFVGITYPGLNALVPGSPKTSPHLASAVVEAAMRLRDEGAAFVVALLHDGVDWGLGSCGENVPALRRLALDCGPWISHVDAILAGHTLGRFVGTLGGKPFAQPWPFGAEVGVVELNAGGEGRAYGVGVETGGRWNGAGSALIDETESRVVGRLAEPLCRRAGGPSPLVNFMAEGLREATGTDAAVVAGFEGGYHQPPVDGVLSFLPAGPVTEADLLRVVYWIEDSTVRLDLSPRELRVFAEGLSLPPSGPTGLDAPDEHGRSRRTLTVAMSSWTAARLEGWIGRGPELVGTGIGLRNATRGAVARASVSPARRPRTRAGST